MSAARSKNFELAQMALQALAQRAQSEQEGDLRPAIAIMEREVAGIIELARGRTSDALQALRAAAQAELALPAPLGVPKPIKPAPELLGEVLLESGQPREAAEWFQRALARNANRSLSVLGLARAASASGDAAAARERYRELLANYDRADADLPELAEAKAAPNKTDPAVSASGPVIGVRSIAGALAVILVLGFVVLWGRRTTSARKPQTTQRTQRKRT